MQWSNSAASALLSIIVRRTVYQDEKKNTEKRCFYAGTDDSRYTVRNDRKFVGIDLFIVVIDI